MTYFRLTFAALFAMVLLVSCSKEKRGPWKLHSGNGIWHVESMQWIQYDSLGNETLDSTLLSPGEFVFLSTHWGTAKTFLGKFVEHDISGEPVATYPIDYNSDGKKLTIEGALPVPFAGFFSIERNGFRNHKWTALNYFADQSYPNRIRQRMTVTLKKGKS